MIRDMEKQGLVEPSTFPYVAPAVMRKKLMEHPTFVIITNDNNVTESDAYPMPDLNKFIRKMSDTKYFSV